MDQAKIWISDTKQINNITIRFRLLYNDNVYIFLFPVVKNCNEINLSPAKFCKGVIVQL